MVAGLLILVAGALLYPQVREWRVHQQRLRALDGDEPEKRLSAAINLGRSGDARSVAVLVDTLVAAEGAQRRDESVDALCAVGPRAVRSVAAALDTSPAGSASLAEALACIDDRSAREALAAFLSSGPADRVGAAFSILSTTGDERIAGMILQAAARADRARRLVILGALGSPVGGALNPRLAKLLTDAEADPDPAVRTAAAARRKWIALNLPGSTGEWDVSAGDSSGADLTAAAGRAREMLKARQQSAGFWRTAITPKPSYLRARAERNTYLTPMIVDLLDPVADEAGLRSVLDRATAQVSAEIEENGLVRYYGAPRADDRSPRRCTISYDADDTALAWRVAPLPDQGKLRRALDTLRRFRAENGLYRTWLTPLREMECVDRGDNPNPTDVGIQMHVLMLLSRTSPPDAASLCTSLRASIGDDRIWVYYRQQPIVPILRSIDLEAAGCALEIPERFRRTPVGGQGMWLAVARALSQPLSRGGRKAALSLLDQIAKDDFLAIRRSPPLLYQNDASGAVPAFYWSEEYGFALWLRLYLETRRQAP